MRVVLATTGLLAAFLSRRACHDLLEHAQQHHRIVLPSFIPEAFRSKRIGNFRVPEPVIPSATALLAGAAELVEPMLLVGAWHGLTTGERDLLAIGAHAGVRILAPAEFRSFEAEDAEGT